MLTCGTAMWLFAAAAIKTETTLRTAQQHADNGLCAQADRRALNITLNSINTEVSRDEKRKLYSDLGLLYPQGHQELAMAEDFDQIKVSAGALYLPALPAALHPRPERRSQFLFHMLCCIPVHDSPVQG